jgi:hypothetical protein
MTVMLLASCSGARPPTAAEVFRTGKGDSGDLLYVTTYAGTVVLRYPQGIKLAVLPGVPVDVCSDPNSGNVFITDHGIIKEYAHGGTAPIATLTTPSEYGALSGCSINPTTGDLAVAFHSLNDHGGVLVYKAAAGDPTTYVDSAMYGAESCAYDSSGNLFVIGPGAHSLLLTELPSGGSGFQDIMLGASVGAEKVEWDGTYLTLRSEGNPEIIYRIAVSGSTGTIVGTVHLSHDPSFFWTYWIQGNTVISTYNKRGRHPENTELKFFDYPLGGKATKTLAGVTQDKRDFVEDMTVSVTPRKDI